MLIGCPKEIKDNERRVGLTPGAAGAYCQAGHRVLVEKGAGLGSGFDDDQYRSAGAEIIESGPAIWRRAEMIVKVKEPTRLEYPLMQENQIVFTYFHLAAERELTRACLERKVSAVAYETVTEDLKTLPLLKPMSEVAGRMSILMGAYFSACSQGGQGLLPTGTTGVAPAEVLVLGGGTVGQNAAMAAAGLRCQVTILEIDAKKLAYLDSILPANVQNLFNDPLTLERKLKSADIIIGAVLIPGAVTPKLIRYGHLSLIKPGSVLVDVAIDQGGCFESSRMTSHSDPVFMEEGLVHYCVGNMPGAYPRTSTLALTAATLVYGLELANRGLVKAVAENAALRRGLNTYQGQVTLRPVAEALDLWDCFRDIRSGLK
ncbi:MAG: alanine dehydrogenase [Deltaproteobacteria bacterium]|jgi:alanine dehydrogenase|nr:alanine dehydrogenase [Deltaproteobacteria bacterium]